MTSSSENKAIVHRAFAMVNAGDLSGIASLIAPNFVHHSVPDGRGPEVMQGMLGMFFAGFPDMKVTIEDTIAEGDKVATRGYFTGTRGSASSTSWPARRW